MLKGQFATQSYYRLAVNTFFFVHGLTFASWNSRIPNIQEILELNDAALGGVLSSMPFGQLTAMFLSGFIISKFGSKKILTITAVLYPLSLLILGTVTSAWQLSAGLFIFGFFANICNLAVNTQGVGVERLYKRNILASFHGVWSMAGFFGGVLSSFLAGNRIGPFHHFIIILVTSFILILLARNALLPRDGAKFEKTKHKFFEKPDKLIVLLGLIALADMFCEGAMFYWSGIYFKATLHLPEALVRTGFIAFMLTMALGRFMADKLRTQFGAIKLIMVSGFITFMGLIISITFPYLVPATVGFLLVGLGTSSIIPTLYSIAGKSTTMKPGMAVTTVSLIGFIGFLVGSPIIGSIAEALNLRWAFGFIAIMGIVIIILSQKLSKYLK